MNGARLQVRGTLQRTSAGAVIAKPKTAWSRRSVARRSRVGLRRMRFHDLHHTAATLLLRQGVHPKVVAEMLGHSTISITTLDTCSHALPDMQRDASAAMDRLIRI